MAHIIKTKEDRRYRRHARVRGKVSGVSNKPRLAVFRSNKAIYAQVIDDEKGETLASASSLKTEGKTMTDKATTVGKTVAEVAKGKGVSEVVFDRGGFTYTGTIKALADAAREGGLKF